jgi:hypothetical protein
MSLFIQDRITQELQYKNFYKCIKELEGTRKPITLLRACIDKGAAELWRVGPFNKLGFSL